MGKGARAGAERVEGAVAFCQVRNESGPKPGDRGGDATPLFLN